MAWEEYRDTLHACRDGIRTTKASLVRDIKGSKKDYYRCICSQKKTTENMDLLLNGVSRGPGDKDIEKTEELSATFSVFKTNFQESQVPQISEKVWSKQYLPSVEETTLGNT